MTDNLVTITCPLSQLHTIMDALSWAEHLATSRAENILLVNALHNADPKSISPYISDGIDQVKHYREDAKTFKEAHNIAFLLWANSVDVAPLTDAEAPQTRSTALSEAVAF